MDLFSPLWLYVSSCRLSATGGAPQLAPRASQSCGGIGMFGGVPQILLLVIHVQSRARLYESYFPGFAVADWNRARYYMYVYS